MKVCKNKLCLSKVHSLSWRKYNCCRLVECFDASSLLVQWIVDCQWSSEILIFRLGFGVLAIKIKQSVKQNFIQRSFRASKKLPGAIEAILECSDGLASSSDIGHHDEEFLPLQMCLPH
jgi:hypothetical protein